MQKSKPILPVPVLADAAGAMHAASSASGEARESTPETRGESPANFRGGQNFPESSKTGEEAQSFRPLGCSGGCA